MIGGWWLMRHGLADADSAFQILKELRKGMPDAYQPSPQIGGELRKLRTWKLRA